MKFKWEWTGQEATLLDLQRQVGPGWSKIVQDMCEDLEALGWDGSVYQIKEKFGGLRFYFEPRGIPDKFRRIAFHTEFYYEGHSLQYCEECGNPGHARGPGWIRTLCKAHAIKNGKNLLDHEKEKA